MLSVNLIERLFESKRYCRLLDAVADRGLALPLPLRIRLSQSPTPAVALALGRLMDLTYGPTSLSAQMADHLLSRQLEDGSFGRDPLETACATAALGRVAAEPGAALMPPVEQAYAGALAALTEMQDADGLFRCENDRTEQQRELVAAFILFLLAGDERFQAAVRTADLWGRFESRGDELDQDTRRLWRLARAEAPDLAVKAPLAA